MHCRRRPFQVGYPYNKSLLQRIGDAHLLTGLAFGLHLCNEIEKSKVADFAAQRAARQQSKERRSPFLSYAKQAGREKWQSKTCKSDAKSVTARYLYAVTEKTNTWTLLCATIVYSPIVTSVILRSPRSSSCREAMSFRKIFSMWEAPHHTATQAGSCCHGSASAEDHHI